MIFIKTHFLAKKNILYYVVIEVVLKVFKLGFYKHGIQKKSYLILERIIKEWLLFIKDLVLKFTK